MNVDGWWLVPGTSAILQTNLAFMRETSGLNRQSEERQIEVLWEQRHLAGYRAFYEKNRHIPEHSVWSSTKDDESPLAQPVG